MQLSETLPQPGSVTVGDKEYTMHPITPGDIAKAQRFIKDRRLADAMRATRNVPLSDNARAKMIADIANFDIDVATIFTGFTGQLYLVWLSVCKSGEKPARGYDEFEASVEQVDVTTLATHLMVLSGLLSPKALEDAMAENPDPLAEDSISTARPRTFNGTGS